MTNTLYDKIPRNWQLQSAKAGWSRDPKIRESLDFCRKITKEHARSFYFASIRLPREKKFAAYSIYAFCRWVDDVIDEGTDNGRIPSRQELEQEFQKLKSNNSPLPFALGFNRVRDEYKIPDQLFLDLIEGCCRDREPVAIETYNELEDYCYYVASVVGLMMCPLFGLTDKEALPRAVDMGVAMQLTNILRDVREDAAIGRRYLPAEELRAAGIDPNGLLVQTVDDRWQSFMRDQIMRNREIYERAIPGLTQLANDGSRQTAILMTILYRQILMVIERRGYDNLTSRAFVTTTEKIRLGLKAYFRGISP